MNSKDSQSPPEGRSQWKHKRAPKPNKFMYQQKKKEPMGKEQESEQPASFLDLKKPKSKIEDEKILSPQTIKQAAAIIDANNQ